MASSLLPKQSADYDGINREMEALPQCSNRGRELVNFEGRPLFLSRIDKRITRRRLSPQNGTEPSDTLCRQSPGSL